MTDPRAMMDHVIDLALGKVKPAKDDVERRDLRRLEYDGELPIVMTSPTSGKGEATVVTCKDICIRGACVRSRNMLHEKFEGAALMRRANGTYVVLDLKVIYCHYAGEAGHESGIHFLRESKKYTVDDFRDAQGNLPDFCATKKAA